MKRKNINPVKNISVQENEALHKFPAYLSIVAASNNDKLDEAEKKSAIKFAHTKTFCCDPLLDEFYKQADKVFENNIKQLEKELPREKKAGKRLLKRNY